ncbi:hypothetical protein [Streptomyces caeruleatus]|uniref:hypothetical protein n=1 Tax=Streptomyces caeruleatus TaxID=661399 RepID=UPI000AB28A59|nr:hypothetical protein [Streptomyces caeruleatus]
MLHGPAGQRLFVAERPRYPHQFVVGALAPDGPRIKPHRSATVKEPNSIAVAKDPARTAARVARRVLPRYQQALQAVLDNATDEPDLPHRPAYPRSTRSSP